MKNSIKLLIFTLLITITCDSLAQSFGIKAGYNSSIMLIEESETGFPYETTSYNNNIKMKHGFNIGAIAEFPILKYLTLETGVILNTRGYKNSYEDNTFDTTIAISESHNLYYLDIPLSAKIPFSIKGLNFYGSLGGYGGMGLFGNTTTNVTYGSLSEKEEKDIEWGSDPVVDDYKSFDYGVSVGAGVILNSLQIGVSYNLGLANISPNSDNGDIMNNRVMGISVAYLFGSSKKGGQDKISSAPIQEESKTAKVKPKSKKEAELEAERVQQEKIRTDSIAAVKAEEERIRAEKAEADSIEAAKVMAASLAAQNAARLAQIKSDSISAAQNAVIYRVQFASNTTKKGSYEITIGGKKYSTWEYSYSGAYRSTIGEFNTYKSALDFQKTVRQSGYPQAFVVALKNNVRTTDPALFK